MQVPVQGGVQLVHKGHLDRAEQWLSLVLDLWHAKAKLNSRGEYGFTGDQVGEPHHQGWEMGPCAGQLLNTPLAVTKGVFGT